MTNWAITKDHVRRLAEKLGTNDPDAIARAIYQEHRDGFCGRPMYVDVLLDADGSVRSFTLYPREDDVPWQVRVLERLAIKRKR